MIIELYNFIIDSLFEEKKIYKFNDKVVIKIDNTFSDATILSYDRGWYKVDIKGNIVNINEKIIQ